MGDLKMPEINTIMISGNLTRDPIYRQTNHGSSVVNFTIASNKKYRDTNNKWQEIVCFVGVVAWNRLAESCVNRLKKGSPVVIDGELQNHLIKNDDGTSRSIVEVKARRIQFLHKKSLQTEFSQINTTSNNLDEEPTTFEDDSFDKFLTSEESQLLKEQISAQTQE